MKHCNELWRFRPLRRAGISRPAGRDHFVETFFCPRRQKKAKTPFKGCDLQNPGTPKSVCASRKDFGGAKQFLSTSNDMFAMLLRWRFGLMICFVSVAAHIEIVHT